MVKMVQQTPCKKEVSGGHGGKTRKKAELGKKSGPVSEKLEKTAAVGILDQ